jgi:hypothetical protein
MHAYIEYIPEHTILPGPWPCIGIGRLGPNGSFRPLWGTSAAPQEAPFHGGLVLLEGAEVMQGPCTLPLGLGTAAGV